MATISLTTIADGALAVAADLRNNFAAIATAINGGIDTANVNAIAQSKITFDAALTYVPAWTSTGVAPAIGNGTLSGRYVVIGKNITGTIALTAGTTTTFGSGTYFWSLPVTSSASIAVGTPVGNVQIFDTSASARYSHLAITNTTTTLFGISQAAPAGTITNTTPVTFATGDQILVSFGYEAA